ncbi:MAG TPA: hypothetical protein VNO25_21615 [Streptosporangiaceae bacterium]|nr:hypothetical protein [Streptosporangiaceae bacterium]
MRGRGGAHKDHSRASTTSSRSCSRPSASRRTGFSAPQTPYGSHVSVVLILPSALHGGARAALEWLA